MLLEVVGMLLLYDSACSSVGWLVVTSIGRLAGWLVRRVGRSVIISERVGSFISVLQSEH